jgi:hypothetical protein
MAQGTGININLISIERLAGMTSMEKIRFILTEVKRGNVLVLERGLTATEEADLIKTTMSNINHDTFIGIEMQSYSQEDVKRGSWLDKLLRRKQEPRMSVIGPADLLRTVHKDGNMIQTMVLTKESIVGEEKKGKKDLPPPPERNRNQMEESGALDEADTGSMEVENGTPGIEEDSTKNDDTDSVSDEPAKKEKEDQEGT